MQTFERRNRCALSSPSGLWQTFPLASITMSLCIAPEPYVAVLLCNPPEPFATVPRHITLLFRSLRIQTEMMKSQ
eukprot:scaffold249010_cov17-Tisochrysis_lutea.AAC.1